MQKTSRHATFSLSLPYEIKRRNESIMSTITLESIQNELIREILDIKNVKVLESVRKTLIHAKKEMESVSTMVAEDEEPYMTKSEIMDGLSEACKDIKLMREGKLKGRPIEELFNELN